MITLEQFKEMFELQEKLETRISGPDWRDDLHDYALCVHMEGAEIIEQYGWKHWKDLNKVPNLDAVAMEIVDVWHFAMAFMLLSEKFDAKLLYDQLLQAIDEWELDKTVTVPMMCIGMSFAMYVERKFPLGNLLSLMNKVEMTFEDLYKLYISKNVLNWFRQDHGYKEGLYKKDWLGKEDNEHLREICYELGDKLNSKSLYKALQERYATAPL